MTINWTLTALFGVFAIAAFGMSIDMEVNGMKKSHVEPTNHAVTQAFRVGAYGDAYTLLQDTKYSRTMFKSSAGKEAFTDVTSVVSESGSSDAITRRRLFGGASASESDSTSYENLLVYQDYPLDLTNVWNSLQKGDFDSFITTPECFYTNEPNVESGGFSASTCNNNVFRTCSGLEDFLDMCLGSFRPPQTTSVWYDPKDATGTTGGAFYVDLLNVYQAVVTNGKTTFDPSTLNVPECWRALYDYSNNYMLSTPTSTTPPFAAISANSYTTYGVGAGAPMFAAKVMYAFQAQYASNPNQAFFGGNPPLYFLSSSNAAKTDVQKLYTAVFGDGTTNHDDFWDQVMPYPATYAGVDCDALRTEIFNTRGEPRAVNYPNIALADLTKKAAALQCTYGTTPYYCKYTNGVRSCGTDMYKPTDTAAPTGSSGVACKTDSSDFTVEPFKITAATFTSQEHAPTGISVTLTDTNLVANLFQKFKNTLTTPNTYYGYPLAPSDKIEFTISSSSLASHTTGSSNPLSSGVTYMFDVKKADGTSVIPSTDPAIYSSSTGKVTIPANKLPPNTDLWLTMQGSLSGGATSSNMVFVKFRTMGAAAAPTVSTAYASPSYGTWTDPAKTPTLFFTKVIVPAMTSNVVVQTATYLRSLPIPIESSFDFRTWTEFNTVTAGNPNTNNVGAHVNMTNAMYYACSTTKAPVKTDLVSCTGTGAPFASGASTPTTNYYVFFFDQFGNMNDPAGNIFTITK